MTVPSPLPRRAVARRSADRITVLVAAGDRQHSSHLEATLDDDRFAVRTTSSPSTAMDFDGVDCLVSASPTATDDLLERVRQQVPDLPVVVLVDAAGASTATLETIRTHRWVDYVLRHDGNVPAERLEHRIETLLERRRLEALSRRSLASVDLARDAIAIAAPDDDLEFTNRSFAVQFGTDRDDLPGTPWQELFTDETVARLETAAIPTVEDGWRWTGNGTARRVSGEPVSVRLRLVGLEDGSLVFVVDTA